MENELKAPTSKIIQIARFEYGESSNYLLALCEDGSLWCSFLNSSPPSWSCISRFNGNQYEYKED